MAMAGNGHRYERVLTQKPICEPGRALGGETESNATPLPCLPAVI